MNGLLETFQKAYSYEVDYLGNLSEVNQMQIGKFIIKHATNRAKKAREFFENKSKENFAKPKELWKTLKSLVSSKYFQLFKQIQLRIISV